MGLVENMPSGSSYKPGDVLRSRSGKTIEVLNTDAEGRLVLADLLHLASELGADHVVDLATLTGAALIAMGDGVSAVMGTDQKLVDRLMDAGSSVGEYLWQLPLVEEYSDLLKSPLADLKNITGIRWGGPSPPACSFASSWARPPGPMWTSPEAGPARSGTIVPTGRAGKAPASSWNGSWIDGSIGPHRKGGSGPLFFK